MSFDPLTAGLDFGKSLVSTLGKFIPDAEKAQQAAMEIQAQTTNIIMGQLALNQADASSQSHFVSWWRPAVGWICVSGMAYQIVLRPIVQSIVIVWKPDYHMVALEIETLMTILFGMLGLGAYRTYEKIQGVTK